MTDVASEGRAGEREIDRQSSGGEGGLDWADVRGIDWGSALIASASLHLIVPARATPAPCKGRSYLHAACSVLMCFLVYDDG